MCGFCCLKLEKATEWSDLILFFKKNKYFVHKKVSEYDQQIPQSQTADKSMEPRERATQQSRDNRKF